MSTITVLTPTFNRGTCLANLFRSLMRQTTYDFTWMIVDDGSTDDTERKVQRFALQSKFKIRYLRKKNGGKHTALNVGIRKINTPLTLIVDSDDELLPDGVQTVLAYDRKYRGEKDLCGFSFLRVSHEGVPLARLPGDEFTSGYLQCRVRGRVKGDMAEVFYSDVLKKYPFPEFPGEKFLSEDVVWIAIGRSYSCVFVRKPIYRCEYLPDGLTGNDKKLKFASPYGSMMRGKALMEVSCGFPAWMRGAVIYDCYRREIGRRKRKGLPECLRLRGPRCKFLTALMRPAGLFFHWYWGRSV